MEILCFYVNSAFGKEVFPNVLARFTPFQELYTHFYCEIGYFRVILSGAELSACRKREACRAGSRGDVVGMLLSFGRL